ncbi:glycosyltransferase family 9 protein [Candidatus Pelagibacter sp. HIMB1509]|uniref:glycosyltransferase family 9 protein n=1 Tax=Candidatus Pelagibacter sp. HIMB1509 TaxID=3413339 RepID=UPI003F85B22A
MKILAIQNRMGIGDSIMFLPFVEAISNKFNTPVSLLVQESSKCREYLNQTNYIDEIIILKRNNKVKNSEHNRFFGSLRLANELRKYKFNKVFIFNSSLRYNLIAKLSGINKIHQFPLFQKKEQNMIKASNKLIYDTIGIQVKNNPNIHINESSVLEAEKKYNFSKKDLNILLGIGGSGPTKRIPTKTFLKVMKEISKQKKCKFFLATGKNDEEQKILNEIKNSNLKNYCHPLDNLSIKECLPIIKNCNVSICNDSSFSHLSSALGVETITLMADTPLIYGNYSSKMHPVLPDDVNEVTHGTLGKDKINPQKILYKLNSIVS